MLDISVVTKRIEEMATGLVAALPGILLGLVVFSCFISPQEPFVPV